MPERDAGRASKVSLAAGPSALVIDADDHPLQQGVPPPWASGWGEDRHGVWVELTVSDVTQRMRWCPPGQFTMGSPADEPGRFDNEGPMHQVVITRGFWLFDTPCTQALWQAVMGDNPSRFKSAERPVETVSWEDCQSFLRRIERLQAGLGLSLPTEAQWEHACRAGSDTALYTGPIEILGDANAPALDDCAWYAGNSNVDFDLDNGMSLDVYADRRFGTGPSGSHPVRLKCPNAFGLYDTLGNVWEWCLDEPRTYGLGLAVDPVGSERADARRVVRGGSWGDHARHVRCAFRDAYPPGGRFDYLGFRPARVHS